MTGLYASVIRLRAVQAGWLEYDPGQWANAAFYALLNQVDPDLSHRLHSWNGRKPFTISSLHGLPRTTGASVQIAAGRECWLRLTTLGETLFHPFIQHFILDGAHPTIRLGPLEFLVSEVLSTSGSHPWAGYMEVEALIARASPVRRVSLEFASPTAFNLGSSPGAGAYYDLFPHPPLVFGGSLARVWHDFIDAEQDSVYIEDIAAGLRVADYRLETHTLRWKGHVQKGFTGWCTFDTHRLSPHDAHLLSCLAEFSFFAGVGGKTTQGMGQCRRVQI